jgi:Predicted membrane protein
MTMHPDLIMLAFTLILALVQILLTVMARTAETGMKWNAGPRDTPSDVPVGVRTGRLQRAQANLFETLPIFIGAVLIAQIADKSGHLTMWGTHLYFFARVFYVPLYAWGVTGLRSLVWAVSLVGLVLILVALFQ